MNACHPFIICLRYWHWYWYVFCSFTSLSLPRFPSPQWPVCLQWFVLCCEDNALFRNLFRLSFQVSQQEQHILYIYIQYSIVYILSTSFQILQQTTSTNHWGDFLYLCRQGSLPSPPKCALYSQSHATCALALEGWAKTTTWPVPATHKWWNGWGVSVDVFFLQLSTTEKISCRAASLELMQFLGGLKPGIFFVVQSLVATVSVI